jgi:hypothetical protein
MNNMEKTLTIINRRNDVVVHTYGKTGAEESQHMFATRRLAIAYGIALAEDSGYVAMTATGFSDAPVRRVFGPRNTLQASLRNVLVMG